MSICNDCKYSASTDCFKATSVTAHIKMAKAEETSQCEDFVSGKISSPLDELISYARKRAIESEGEVRAAFNEMAEAAANSKTGQPTKEGFKFIENRE